MIYEGKPEKFKPVVTQCKGSNLKGKVILIPFQAYRELVPLLILVGVTVLTVSSIIIYAEKHSEHNWTFVDSFWWGLMTISTGKIQFINLEQDIDSNPIFLRLPQSSSVFFKALFYCHLLPFILKEGKSHKSLLVSQFSSCSAF